MLTLNYRDSRPIYGQIKDGLRRMIVTGALEPEGDPARRQELTSRLRELIAELKYLHMTDGEILSLLREEGAHND